MHALTTIQVADLRQAAARLGWNGGCQNGTERAIWIAAKNHRSQRSDSIELPKALVDRVNELLQQMQADEPNASQVNVD